MAFICMHSLMSRVGVIVFSWRLQSFLDFIADPSVTTYIDVILIKCVLCSLQVSVFIATILDGTDEKLQTLEEGTSMSGIPCKNL